MTIHLLRAAAAALVLLVPAAALADGPPLPRAYTAADCQELTAQLDDSIRFSNPAGPMTASIAQQRAYGQQACAAGRYDIGARQLRDALDLSISSRTY
jgi:hypothetical protein